MAFEKILNTRIQLKYDSYTNWSTKNPTLKSGEVAIAYLANTVDTSAVTPDNSTHPVMFKVGPGAFNSLPWASALAADVHSWAKKSEAEFKTWVKGLIDVTDIDAYSKKEVDDKLTANSTADQKYAKEYADGLIAGLDVTDTAVTGKYVSAVNEVDGKVVISREDLPTYSLTSGSVNGTVAFNGADVAVTGLGSAAYTAANAYATAAQGALADSAVQTIATGSANGTIAVDGTDVAVKGLGTAAYTASTAYATAEQGSKADSAVQSVTVLGTELSDGDELTVAAAKTALGLKSAAYTESTAYATAAQGQKADSAVQKVTVLGKELTDGSSVSVDEAKTALGLKSAAYEEASAFDAAGAAAAVLGTTGDAAGAATVHGALKAAAAAQSDIDAFFAAAETGDAAIDTLKEIQDFLTGDEGGVKDLLDAVQENKDAIEDIVDGTTKVASAANADVAAKASGLDASGEAAVKAVKVDNAVNADKADSLTDNAKAEVKAVKVDNAGHSDTTSGLDATAIAQVEGIKVDNAVNAEQLGGVAANLYATKAYADQAEADALSEAKKYADGLAGNYATAEQGAKADTAVQPAALNSYYTKSEADAAFMDSTETGNAIDAKINALNLATTYEPIGAETRAKAYADGLAGNYATAAQGTKADSALQEITTPTESGLKVSAKENNKQSIEFDPDCVFVFNCGSASELV